MEGLVVEAEEPISDCVGVFLPENVGSPNGVGFLIWEPPNLLLTLFLLGLRNARLARGKIETKDGKKIWS